MLRSALLAAHCCIVVVVLLQTGAPSPRLRSSCGCQCVCACISGSVLHKWSCLQQFDARTWQ